MLFLAQKERLDGFSTRRVRLANSLFYVPFCSAKRWTKSSSLSALFALYRKKVPGKIPIPFLAQKERLDGFSTRRVRLANSLFYVPFCSAKRWTKSSSLSAVFFAIYRKKVPGKSRYLSWRRRRDSTGFLPVVFALRTVYFMSLLLRKKMDGEFESLQTNSYIQKEKAQRKNPCAFSGAEGETRTLAPVTRPTPLAGAPRHQLEYFCIGSVYDTIRLLKERAENPLSLLSGGESGIRTHGTLPYDGFQDRSVITTSVSLRIRRKL